MKENEKYQPSNGTEGCWFVEKYCMNCIHEKFMHTNKDDDLQCDIFNRTLLFDSDEKEYPEEWTYDENDRPICTEYKHWDWGRDDNDDGLNEPPEPITDDPNQLCFPFIFEEIGVQEIQIVN